MRKSLNTIFIFILCLSIHTETILLSDDIAPVYDTEIDTIIQRVKDGDMTKLDFESVSNIVERWSYILSRQGANIDKVKSLQKRLELKIQENDSANIIHFTNEIFSILRDLQQRVGSFIPVGIPEIDKVRKDVRKINTDKRNVKERVEILKNWIDILLQQGVGIDELGTFHDRINNAYLQEEDFTDITEIFARFEQSYRSIIINQSHYFEFYLPWDDSSPSIVDVSFLLDPPAGKHGFLKAKGADLCFEDGTKARFWGFSVSAIGIFDVKDKEILRRMSDKLAKLGVNIIRITHMDANPDWSNIFMNGGKKTTIALDHGNLDKLDYFIYLLKERGIYIYLDLLTDRIFMTDDSVYGAPIGKWVFSVFDGKMIELQKKFIQDLFSHKNPYTGIKYVDEPAIAMCLINNEESLLQRWTEKDSALSRKNELIKESKIFLNYYKYLEGKWQKWLMDKYENIEKLKASWDEAGRISFSGDENAFENIQLEPKATDLLSYRRFIRKFSAKRWSDLTKFYYDVDFNYFKDIYNFIRSINVRSVILGTNAHIMGFQGGGLPGLKSMSLTSDAIDLHLYNFHFFKPFVKEALDDDNYIHALSMSVKDKPTIISEFNHILPSPYRSEAPLIISSYASLHGVDAIIWFSYTHSTDSMRKRNISDGHVLYDLVNDVSVITQFPIMALLFLRGDVKSAEDTIELEFTDEETFGQIMKWMPRSRMFAPALKGKIQPVNALVHKTLVSDFNAEYKVRISSETTPANPFVSDTKEIFWDTQGGIFKVNTERIQGVVGFVKDKIVEFNNMEIYCKNGFAAITLAALDKQKIQDSVKLLLATTAGMVEPGLIVDIRVKGEPRVINRSHNGNILMEPVCSKIILKLRHDADSVYEIWALDERGRRKVKIIHAERELDNFRELMFDASGNYKTCWYEISLKQDY